MICFSRIKSYFYLKEKTFSRDQLNKDFGCFPPLPLNCKKIDFPFSVVRTRGVGNLYQQILMFRKLWQSDESDIETRLFELDEIVSVQVQEMIEAVRVAKNALGGVSRYLKYILISIVLPITIIKLLNSKLSRNSMAGYFMPIFKSDIQINVINNAKRSPLKIDSIISHEHIHFIQFMRDERYVKKIRAPETILPLKYLNDEFLLYILERHEVEARLHEVVLSYYRANNILPLSVEGFFELLAGSKQLDTDNYLTDLFALNGIEIKHDINIYIERHAEWVEQLDFVIVNIKDHFLQYKFIAEVLTVMYGNLLRYYGDDDSSFKFMGSIDRPNLYDILYN